MYVSSTVPKEAGSIIPFSHPPNSELPSPQGGLKEGYKDKKDKKVAIGYQAGAGLSFPGKNRRGKKRKRKVRKPPILLLHALRERGRAVLVNWDVPFGARRSASWGTRFGSFREAQLTG